MGIMFFIPSCAFAVLIVDCLKTRSLEEIRNYPIVAIAILLIEILAIEGLAHLKKTAKGEKLLTADEIPSRISGKDSNGHSNNRLVFLISVTTHSLGLVGGFLLAWYRYRP